MKKVILTFVLCSTQFFSYAQPTLNNIENFVVGMTLVFQECDTSGVKVGKKGGNRIWDFSDLQSLNSKTITEDMILPDSTNYKDQFPTANLVEKYSDGRLVFAEINKNENYLVGFVDNTIPINMKYEKPMLFAKRPIHFSDSISDTYTTKYNIKNLDFKGQGTVTIIADGYGTLVLPNGKFENVLRVKITQQQKDTLVQYSTNTSTSTVTYVWFNDKYRSALLKISKTKSDYYSNKTVEYLLKESN